MDVNIGWQGCQGDARIYAMSDLGIAMRSDPPLLPQHYWFLGDKAYPLSHKATREFPGAEQRFIGKHSQTRVVVERGLGALKNKFTRLNTEITPLLEKLTVMTYAMCILHNMCHMSTSGGADFTGFIGFREHGRRLLWWVLHGDRR